MFSEKLYRMLLSCRSTGKERYVDSNAREPCFILSLENFVIFTPDIYLVFSFLTHMIYIYFLIITIKQ